MSYQLINRSAHDTGLADRSVHVAVTSPPYYGLRAYSGDQGIEWPTVEYSPMPGLPPIRIQGCEPGCRHEWVDGTVKTQTPQRDSNNGAFLDTKGETASKRGASFKTTQGAYCNHCGGWRGPLGLEPTIEAYIGHLILVLRELWRVLRDDGTVWFNIGDSMNGSGGAHTLDHANPGISKSAYRDGTGEIRNLSTAKFHGGKAHLEQKRVVGGHGLPPKNMLMIPARFALAAQAEGWYLRSAMPWIKRNGMPESVTDRPAQVIEWIFLLAKQERYFWDGEAVKQPISGATIERFGDNLQRRNPSPQGLKVNGVKGESTMGADPGGRNFRSSDLFFKTWQGLLSNDEGDPLAMVVNPRPYSGAHFACFPELIPEIAIKAGSSQYGCCPACGAPWERVVEREAAPAKHERGTDGTGQARAMNGNADRNIFTGPQWYANPNKSVTTGWRATCSCGRDDVAPCTVLDPFAGSGTTLRVALALGRKPVGVDISESYLDELVPERTSNVQMQLAL